MKVYHVETKKDCKALMIELEVKGYKWRNGKKPTRFDVFKAEGKDTYIYDESGVLSFSDVEYFKKYHSYEPIIEYKSKGDKQMLNTECKQCHKKWHHTNAKYCSMCGKKLIAEPYFKVCDYVTYEGVFENKIAKIDSINEDELHGLWYGQEEEGIRRDCWFKGGQTVRHATDREIAEYEAALTFHKHGRKPFEVKRGDVVYLKGYDKNIFLDSGNIYKKHNFIDGDVVFVKTAEEVNEWL